MPHSEAFQHTEASQHSATFEALLTRMTQAICAGDAAGAAACFTPDGVYHDGFYGEFHGREAIARMISEHFHANARDFWWRVNDCCASGELGYASYEFGYRATMPGYEGKAVTFRGMSRCRLRDGLIHRYDEVFERAQALAQLGFSDERIVRSVKKWAREMQ